MNKKELSEFPKEEINLAAPNQQKNGFILRPSKELKVRPKENYVLLGSDTRLDKNKIYDAEVASNQPDYEEKGLIFVEGVLLGKEDYEIIS